MVATVKKEDFNVSAIMSMRAGQQIMVECSNFSQMGSVQSLVRLTSLRKVEELAHKGIASIKSEKLGDNNLLVTAIPE